MEQEERPDAATVFPGFGELSADVHDVVDCLAAMRREQGLSQTQVAARMRTSQSAVARLEAGQDDIRISTLRRYAHALGQTVRFGVGPTADDEGSA